MSSRVYQIGFVGHAEHRFFDADCAKKFIRSSILILMDQYHPNPVCINTFFSAGTGFWASSNCFEYGIDYHLFLPCLPEVCMNEIPTYAINDGEDIIDRCSGMTIAGQEMSKETICDCSRTLVDQSDFIVAFWEGHKSGLTYETINYALENSKIVLDGLNDLSFVSKKRFPKADRGE